MFSFVFGYTTKCLLTNYDILSKMKEIDQPQQKTYFALEWLCKNTRVSDNKTSLYIKMSDSQQDINVFGILF